MEMKGTKRSSLLIALFATYILLLTAIILFKLPFYSEEISDGLRVINLIPFQGSFNENGSFLLREIIQNTLIFIPLGIYICMLKGKWSLTRRILPIIGLTLAFEVLQYVFALGRSDITDIIDNTLGGLIGICIYALLRKIFKNKTDKVVTILALTLTVFVVARFAHLFYLSHFIMRRLRG